MPAAVTVPNPSENQPVTGNRRKHRRYPGKAVVHVVRERDSARTRLPAKVLEISVAGIGLVSAARFEVGEQVRVCLQNDVQRFAKEVRGVVRWMAPMTEGEFRLGIELIARLSANDLLSLTRVGGTSETGTAKIWV